MQTWSTDSVKASEGFSFWREAVCQTVLDVSPESPPDRFRARISGARVGAFRFAEFEATSHEIVRHRADALHSPSDAYLISLQRRGQSRISQGDDRFLLDPDEIAVLDGERPFRVAFPEPVSRVIAVVPRSTLDVRAPWLRKRPLRKLEANARFASLARQHLSHLADCSQPMREAEAMMLADNLCNLLALASVDDVAARDWDPGLQMEALLAFCRRNLSDPDLSPQRVASRFGMSVRTIHLRFETIGQTFGQWLLLNRLDACAKALRDRHQAQSNISDIAYRWGFNDLSHFTKSFRRKFEMTPREWRKLGRD